MKIKKALDKAKLTRQETVQSQERFPASPEITSKEESIISYTESRFVTPDWNVAESNRCVCMLPDADPLYIDAYKLLKTQIQRNTLFKDWKTLMVTSAVPGDGKTLTSINLALTFARTLDLSVLLMDCDLHRQDVHKYMGIESNLGIIDYFLDDVPLKDLIIWPGIDKMTFISGGRIMKETTEFLNSPRMQSLVTEVKNRYENRYVIFDVPPVLVGADAIAFASYVDCIIMVVDAEKTPIEEIKKAMDLLPEEKFLGFVLNKDNSMTKVNYYYSYYSMGS